MKKKLLIFILFGSLFGGAFTYFDLSFVSSENVEVTLSSTFDNDNIITTTIDVGDGASFSLDENIELIDNYRFEFFVVNGVVMDDYLIDHVFSTSNDIVVQAVFAKEGFVATLFVDDSGNLLNVQYLLIGEDATEPSIEYPVIEGYVVSDNVWDKSLSNILVSTLFTLEYNLLVASEPVEVSAYSADFEDASKSSYEAGLITTYGGNWTLSDALIGSLDNDQSNDIKSVRLRNGFMATEFAVENLYRISFYVGRYLGDSASVISVEISTDKTNWIEIDSNIDAATEFTSYEYILTNDVYTNLGLDNRGSYYIRILSVSDERVNIDDVELTMLDYDEQDIVVIPESTTLTITLPSNLDNLLSLGDTFVDPGCVATDSIIGNVDCVVTGSVDTSNIGGYTVTYSAVDGEGLSKTIEIEYVVFRDESLLDIDYTGYYDGIEGLYGEDLLLALREILNEDLVRQSYGDVRYILDETDVDPNNPDNVLLIYTRDSVSGVWDDGVSWNREHVWPNSRLGVSRVDNYDRNIASDLHNLRAADPGENSSRSNEVYGITDTADIYYPGVDATGDVARILFYMAVMYEELELVNDVLPNDVATNYLPSGAKMSILDYLITWHYAEPVDNFEINRNEVIYSYQHNRNPFIDYPYLVELVWYTHVNIPE